jgi:hypothetical protein
MTKRGKVLREPTSGPGLLMMEGQQYRFPWDVWRSVAPPKAGLVVDVELDAQGGVQAVTVVPDSQLTKEQAEASMVLARPKDRNMPSSLITITRIGLIRLAAAGLLCTAWFFLTDVSVQVPFPGRLEFTFWQMLGFLQPSNVPELLDGHGSPGAGLYGLVAIAALAGPFLHHFWKDKRAFMGGLLPLAVMIVVGVAVRTRLQSALGAGNEGNYAETSKTVSLGLGAYLSILVGLYFAFIAAQGFLAATRGARHQIDSPRRKAA